MEIGTSSDVEIEYFPEWPELKRLVKENRCELVITGEDLSLRKPSVNEEILQKAIFRKDSPLNFLDLSNVNLTVLYSSLSRLTCLSNLLLRLNHLNRIPEELCSLEKLKVLDVSYNKIESLPEGLGQLKSLTTLNVSNNKLQQIPNLSGLLSLRTLDLSSNALVAFPLTLPKDSSKFQELFLGNNQIQSVPEILKECASLKTLDLSKNRLRDLPVSISYLPKLKELNLSSNCFSDKRFGKLAEDKRHSVPSVMGYLKKKAAVLSKVESTSECSEGNDVSNNDAVDRRIIIRYGVSKAVVVRKAPVIDIRSYIACCILHNVSFDGKKLKRFFSIQTKIHDTLCARRTLATIGTHDCSKLSFPLQYSAMDPYELQIVPLHRKSQMSGRELITVLMAEGEMVRKKQKMNELSSLHRYLCLVEKLTKYPCIVDASNTVVSFPPVTNSESTKLTEETRDVFVEVTSNQDQGICRSVMDRLIEETFKEGLAPELEVEQIKVLQENGNLLIAYPGKLDLQLPDVNIIREVMKDEDP